MGRRRYGEDGAVAVEFAYLLPILVMLLMGIVQFGLAMWRVSVVESAAREGARVAAMGAPPAEIESRAKASATGFDPDTELAVNILSACDGLGDDVRVQVVASGVRLGISIPFWGTSDPTYTAEATFRCERP